MSISFSCVCGKKYRVADDLAGKKSKCKACGQAISVPTPQAAHELEPADLSDLSDGGYALSGTPQPMGDDAFTRMVTHSSTVASNAGRSQINFFHYFRHYPNGLIVYGLTIIAGLLLMAVHPACGIIAAVGLYLLVQETLTVRARFRTGDVNPAVVLSLKPPLIAISADLSTRGSGNKPAVMIIRKSLSGMTGGPPQLNQRLAAATHYYGNAGSDAWTRIDPTLFNLAITDPVTVDYAVASIPSSDWARLDRSLRQLPSRKPGFYKLWAGAGNQGAGVWKEKVVGGIFVATALMLVLVFVMQGVKKNRLAQSTAADDKASNSAPASLKPTAPARTAAPVPPPTAALPPTTAPAPKSRPPRTRKTIPPAPTREAPIATPPQPAAPGGNVVPAAVVDAKVGDKIEVNDHGTWRICTVVARNGEKARIHYDGWAASWDEEVGPERMRPLNDAQAAAVRAAANGDRVEVNDHGTWRSSLVLKRDGNRALIHYEGWSEHWDEWVGPDRMRPVGSGK